MIETGEEVGTDGRFWLSLYGLSFIASCALPTEPFTCRRRLAPQQLAAPTCKAAEAWTPATCKTAEAWTPATCKTAEAWTPATSKMAGAWTPVT